MEMAERRRGSGGPRRPGPPHPRPARLRGSLPLVLLLAACGWPGAAEDSAPGAEVAAPTTTTGKQEQRYDENTGYDTSGLPSLSQLKVDGQLPNLKLLQVPFDPPFEADAARDHFHYNCFLDADMRVFRLDVAGQPPSVISKLTRDGVIVDNRLELNEVKLKPGEKTIFSIGVTSAQSITYTLVVTRRSGASTELLGLRPLTGNFSVPFHAGELQADFIVAQSFYQDWFVVEYDFADGGQTVSCEIESSATIGDNVAGKGEMIRHPSRYTPSLEKLNGVKTKSVFNLHSPGAGPTEKCSVPIDTWRKVIVKIKIIAADRRESREIRLSVTRKGCERDKYFHNGACLAHCPTFHYQQDFNWRCGACNLACEFCVHWHKCTQCQRNTTLHRYDIQDDGSCLGIRVHAYLPYFAMYQYLVWSTSVLVGLYCIACAFCLVTRVFMEQPKEESESEEDEKKALMGKLGGSPWKAGRKSDGVGRRLE